MKILLGTILGTSIVVAVPTTALAEPAASAVATAGSGATAPAAKAAAVDPASLALAHQILAIGIPTEKRPQMFASLMDSLVAQSRKSTENLGITKDKDFQAVMDRSTQRMWNEMRPIMNAALPDIFESMARSYARQFSTDDLNAILAFVKTPAGQHFFERSPMILKDPDVQAAGQRMSAKLLAKLPEITRETMQDVQDYVARKGKQQKSADPAPAS
jgi:hypothetical protein